MDNNKEQIEKCGEKFDEKKILTARKCSKDVVQKVFKQLSPGLSEKEIVDILDRELFSASAERLWHPTKVRIENSTVKSFPEAFDSSKKLSLGDLISFDVGPVFDDHEGDFGETFIFGENAVEEIPFYNEKKLLVSFSKELFETLKKEFVENKLTGVALYERAVLLTENAGLEFNLRMGGHRLGDFPHAIYFKGKLKDMEFEPQSGLWILEIHVIDRRVSLGAFFEDLI